MKGTEVGDLEIGGIAVAQVWRRGEWGCREVEGPLLCPLLGQLSLSSHPLAGSLAALFAI